ncbi:hypothetical protein ACWDVU_26595, partial [Streptomyces sp. NPDC003333]
TTEDLLALAREVVAGVREAFGITLVNEPVTVALGRIGALRAPFLREQQLGRGAGVPSSSAAGWLFDAPSRMGFLWDIGHPRSLLDTFDRSCCVTLLTGLSLG